jgi:hypothetical protein
MTPRRVMDARRRDPGDVWWGTDPAEATLRVASSIFRPRPGIVNDACRAMSSASRH